jgi:glutamyl-tRNA reductase
VVQLKKKQIRKLFIMNRTSEKAVALAEKLGGEASLFMNIKEVLHEVDLCISSASASHYLLTYELVLKVMGQRDHKKLVCVDISTPRTIEPAVKQIKNVHLLTVDDLGYTLKENMDRRKAAVELVEEIINNKISEYYAKMGWRRESMNDSMVAI